MPAFAVALASPIVSQCVAVSRRASHGHAGARPGLLDNTLHQASHAFIISATRPACITPLLRDMTRGVARISRPAYCSRCRADMAFSSQPTAITFSQEVFPAIFGRGRGFRHADFSNAMIKQDRRRCTAPCIRFSPRDNALHSRARLSRRCCTLLDSAYSRIADAFR